MNCPNCGAENEAEARFCAECETPLNGQPQVETSPLKEEADDKTILSQGPLVVEDAKTVSVTQEELAAVEVEVETPPSPEPEAPPSPPRGGAPGGPGQALTSQRNLIIIAIVALVLLCCCCLTLGLLATAFSDVFQDVMYEFGMGPTQLLFI